MVKTRARSTTPQKEKKNKTKTFRVINTKTGEDVDDAFVLLPTVDSAARVALSSYMEATHNAKVARFLRLWLHEIHDKRKNSRGRGVSHE